MSNNWTDAELPMLRQSEEVPPESEEEQKKKVVLKKGGGDKEDSEGSYYSEGEESEWEEGEEEEDELIIENAGHKVELSGSRDKKADGGAVKRDGYQATADKEAKKKSYDPRTDDIMNIPDESYLINESLKNFQPPVDENRDKSLLSIESHLPDTARRGQRGGVPFDKILMSDDSIEDWKRFSPGYVEQNQTKNDDDYMAESAEDEEEDMDDGLSQDQIENPLLAYIKKPVRQQT